MWTVPQIQHVQSCTAWSHFITRTRVAQAWGLHIFVCLNQVSSTCHVSFLAAPDTDHKHKFSLTHLIYFSYLFDSLTDTHKIYGPRPKYTLRCSTAEWRINTNPISHRMWAQIESNSKWSSLKTSSPEELSLTRILGQIRIKYRKDLWEILLLKMWMNLQKLVQRRPISSHRCVPIMTQRRALQTRILKMENYEKCWLHHCICEVEKTMNPIECQSHWGNLLHCYRREEQVQSVLKLITREEKAWRQVHLRNREQRGNLLQCFHQEMRNQLKSILLEGSKDHFSNTLILWNKNIKSGISQWLYQWATATSLCSKIGITGRSTRIHWISTRTSSSTRRIIYEGKGSPRYSNPKHARNGRNEESSRTTSWRSLSAKLRGNHETIQKLTSQLQQMQEQMNSMNDSGEFQEVESNYSGRLFCVSCQPAMIQVLVPCWAATNACLLTHGIHLDYRKTFLVINFLRLIHPVIILKEFTHAHHKENEDQFHKLQGRGLFSQEMTNKVETQFQCRHLQEGRRPWVL